mgnify:CR=1 FL=1
MEFRIIKKSKKSNARIGLLHTSHGVIETPSFVTVGTQAAIKALPSDFLSETKTQIIIANTSTLLLRLMLLKKILLPIGKLIQTKSMVLNLNIPQHIH